MPKTRPSAGDYEKWCIISDLHSVYLDERAFHTFLQVYAESQFDGLVINGDLLDLQSLSSHATRIEVANPIKQITCNFSDELDFAFENILRPLHQVQPNVPIMVRPGNHERRYIRALTNNTSALREIVEANWRRGRTDIADLLRLDEVNAYMSYGDDGVDFIRCAGRKFALIHGSKLNVNRCKDNLLTYGPGTSGHSHQMLKFERQTYFGLEQWVESGCLRTIRNIEYHDEGHVPTWKHGFVTVWFDKDYGQMSVKQHEILDYRCRYGDTIYAA